MKHALADTVISHSVRSSDLDVLKGFSATQVADGYQATEPFAAHDDTWVITLWRSITSDLGRTEIQARCDAAGLAYDRMGTEHVMHDTELHDEEGAIKPSATPEGTVYVSVQCKETKDNGRLLLLLPEQCNHGLTICTECAGSWEVDYEVRYSDTEAGRELAGLRPAAAP